MSKQKKEPAPVYVSISGELPAIQGEGVASSFQESDNTTFSWKFFTVECVRRGYSKKQVLKAIMDGSLPILTPDMRRITPGDFLDPDNLVGFLQDQNISFPLVHCDFFWRWTEPDHLGGWNTVHGNPVEDKTAKQPPALPVVDNGRKLSDLECEIIYRNHHEHGMSVAALIRDVFGDDPASYQAKRKRIYRAMERHERKMIKKS